MVSSTRQTTRRRRIRVQNSGRIRKRAGAATPPFSVHPEGYAVNAPDARKPK